jgi:hypothetical protein
VIELRAQPGDQPGDRGADAGRGGPGPHPWSPWERRREAR